MGTHQSSVSQRSQTVAGGDYMIHLWDAFRLVGFKIRSSSGTTSSAAPSTSFNTFAYSRGFNSAPLTTPSPSIARQDLKDDIAEMYQPISHDMNASDTRASTTVLSSQSFTTPSYLGKRAASTTASTTVSTKGSIDAFFKRRTTSVVPLSTKVYWLAHGIISNLEKQESLRQLNVQKALVASENLRECSTDDCSTNQQKSSVVIFALYVIWLVSNKI